MKNQFSENIEYSYDWLVREIIKTDFEQKKICSNKSNGKILMR